MDSRVVHIDSGLEWRGGQRQLYLLATEQRARGQEPFVAAQARSRLVLRLRGAGVASAGIRMRGAWHLNAARRLRRMIRTWGANVAHAHDLRSFLLAQSALVGIPDVALVVTCRTPLQRVTLLRRARNRASRFIAPNNEVVAFLESLGVEPTRIDLVPPAVPMHGEVRPRNWKQECRWPSDILMCGVLGGTAPGALGKLEEILSGIPAHLRERARLVILGGAPSGEMRIAGTDAFSTGFVDDIAAAIAGFDLLLSLSGTESMSTAVLDAMALGVAPVAFDSGGAGDYVEHGRSGLLVPRGDNAAFAEAVASLLANPELLDTLSAFGPERASRFSVSAMTDETERVYNRALARHGDWAASLTAHREPE